LLLILTRKEVRSMINRTGLLSFFVAGLILTGCAVYTQKDIRGVEELINQAAAAGAEREAPYEYYSAKEYLGNAKDELKEADYGNAKMFGEKAQSRAEEALRKSR
jgi:hypothetical protein